MFEDVKKLLKAHKEALYTTVGGAIGAAVGNYTYHLAEQLKKENQDNG